MGMKPENSDTSSDQNVHVSQWCQAVADTATYQSVVWGLGAGRLISLATCTGKIISS